MIEQNEELMELEKNLKYLELLSTKFPKISDACTEIINLEAILNLPKGTEHFMADLHGEDEAFEHVLRNASGVIKTKISESFKELSENEQKELCTLIYYPDAKLKKIAEKGQNTIEWYKKTLMYLIQLTRIASSKYTRSKTRKSLPNDFRYIIEELLHESIEANPNKNDYFRSIIETIIKIDRADQFICAISHLIQQLIIDKLHIVGDIYDRGPGAHKIIELLKRHHNYDIQWGNHDILWMGAACGNIACIANVVRICTRYANFETIEDGYGINLLPLARFAMEAYKDDPCTCFLPKGDGAKPISESDRRLIAQMHKAISIIQFKIEHQIIEKHPDFGCTNRDLLHKIDFENATVEIDGKTYKMLDTHFPTINRNDPYKLTEEEQDIIERLSNSFSMSEKLQSHIRELYEKGSLYLCFNSNLLYHAAVPLDENGELKLVKVKDEWCKGKRLFDRIEDYARIAFYGDEDAQKESFARDFMWYLWCGPDSPLFCKDKMATFERYFLSDKEAHKETKGYYFKKIDNEEVCTNILKNFNVKDIEFAHIINGHVPVKIIKGETPVKGNGRLLVIDGGFARAYHKETGIAGYTLIYNSFGMQLIQHEPFNSTHDAIENGSDIKSLKFLVENSSHRVKVADTDIGKVLKTQVKDLTDLLKAYRLGLIKEKQ